MFDFDSESRFLKYEQIKALEKLVEDASQLDSQGKQLLDAKFADDFSGSSPAPIRAQAITLLEDKISAGLEKGFPDEDVFDLFGNYAPEIPPEEGKLTEVAYGKICDEVMTELRDKIRLVLTEKKYLGKLFEEAIEEASNDTINLVIAEIRVEFMQIFDLAYQMDIADEVSKAVSNPIMPHDMHDFAQSVRGLKDEDNPDLEVVEYSDEHPNMRLTSYPYTHAGIKNLRGKYFETLAQLLEGSSGAAMSEAVFAEKLRMTRSRVNGHLIDMFSMTYDEEQFFAFLTQNPKLTNELLDKLDAEASAEFQYFRRTTVLKDEDLRNNYQPPNVASERESLRTILENQGKTELVGMQKLVFAQILRGQFIDKETAVRRELYQIAAPISGYVFAMRGAISLGDVTDSIDAYHQAIWDDQAALEADRDEVEVAIMKSFQLAHDKENYFLPRSASLDAVERVFFPLLDEQFDGFFKNQEFLKEIGYDSLIANLRIESSELEKKIQLALRDLVVDIVSDIKDYYRNCGECPTHASLIAQMDNLLSLHISSVTSDSFLKMYDKQFESMARTFVMNAFNRAVESGLTERLADLKGLELPSERKTGDLLNSINAAWINSLKPYYGMSQAAEYRVVASKKLCRLSGLRGVEHLWDAIYRDLIENLDELDENIVLTRAGFRKLVEKQVTDILQHVEGQSKSGKGEGNQELREVFEVITPNKRQFFVASAVEHLTAIFEGTAYIAQGYESAKETVGLLR